VIDQINRIAKSWFIFRPNDEIWEVDFAYMPADYLEHSGHRTNEEFWRIVPVGTICYIDELDLPIDEHHRRAQEIVEAGSKFAVIGDMQKREIRIFRAGAVETSTDNICIPEMPWFEIPVSERAVSAWNDDLRDRPFGADMVMAAEEAASPQIRPDLDLLNELGSDG
jgi:hypothetical protein